YGGLHNASATAAIAVSTSIGRRTISGTEHVMRKASATTRNDSAIVSVSADTVAAWKSAAGMSPHTTRTQRCDGRRPTASVTIATYARSWNRRARYTR